MKNLQASSHPQAFSVGKVTETTLANGLRVRLLSDSSVPTVSYYTFFRVGSRNEPLGLSGISHLFEHMMFNGSKKYGPGQFDKILESNGGTSNAYTTHDLTVYLDEVAAEALSQVIELEADRMKALSISAHMLESERQVVLEERRMRVDNDITGLMDEELHSLAWKAHAYRWPVIGWAKDIENITKDDCTNYFRTFYAPNNALLYIVGDFESKPILELIKKHYGRIPKGPPPSKVLNSEPEQKGERRASVQHPAQAPSLMVGFRACAAHEDDTLVLDVLQYILGVGQSSRLTQSLVFEQELAVSISVDWSWRIDPGFFVFSVELHPNSNTQAVEHALYELLADIARNGPSEKELQKAKNNLRAHFIRELSTHSSTANALGTYEAFLGSWKRGLELPARYDQITAKQVQDAAHHYFNPERRSVVTLVPTTGSEDEPRKLS